MPSSIPTTILLSGHNHTFHPQNCVKMEAAALVAPPTRNLLVVTTDTREAELSWLGAKLVWLLVAVVELIISTANFTFNQVGHLHVFCSLNAALNGFVFCFQSCRALYSNVKAKRLNI